MSMPIPSEVKSIVSFIFRDGKNKKKTPLGTGFFVGIKNPSEHDIYCCYLVTAKHVLYESKKTLDRVFIRLNNKEGGSEFINIPINVENDNKNVFIHSDESVDIAVIPFEPDQDKYDFSFIPVDMIAPKEVYKSYDIREGSDVFFTGLFYQHMGNDKNCPIVRFGRVALVTDEKINWRGKHMDLYLIEASSCGGNSGSPVFFYLGSDRIPGVHVSAQPFLALAGVMKGSFLDNREIKVVETKKVLIAQSSIGIAAVVPSYKLHEILFGDELKQHRGF